MGNIEEKISKLDNIIEADVYTTTTKIVYTSPNALQASQFGITSVAKKERETTKMKSSRNLDFLADVISDLYERNKLKPTFMEKYNEIARILSSKEFELTSGEKSYAELAKRLGGSYPKYSRNKTEEAFNLIQEQVVILSEAVYQIQNYFRDNNINPNFDYRHILTTDYYDDSTIVEYVVPNSYEKCAECIFKCNDILYDQRLNYESNYAGRK